MARATLLYIILGIAIPLFAFAFEATSTSFKLIDPVFTITGGFATSTSYQLNQATVQPAIGTSSITSFQINSGFLYFPFVTKPVVTAIAGNASVSLSWTASQGVLGWTVSGYTVGQSTAAGGPYTYTSVGNTTSNTPSGLTNNTRYFFVVRPYDVFGNSIATSTEISTIPHNAETAKENFIATSTSSTFTMTNSNGTLATFAIPANFTASSVQFTSFSYPKSEFQSTKPPPSGKDFAGKVYDFILYTASTSNIVSTTLLPATITLSYSDSDVSGISESTLQPYRRGSSDTSWNLISGSTLNTSAKTVTFSTASFSSFTLIGSVASSPAPAPSPAPSSTGGGGGGGGGVLTTPQIETKFILKGKAYPDADLTIFKDGAVAATPHVDSTGLFQVEIKVEGGLYTFSLYAVDSKNRRSLTQSFTINVPKNVTVSIADIVIAPTMEVDKSEVKQGNDITFFGSGFPQSQIKVTVNSETELTDKTNSNNVGVWSYTLGSSHLEKGDHVAKSQTITPDGLQSPFSESIAFRVGDNDVAFAALPKVQKPAPEVCSKNGDINKDGKVNIVDFSILLFFWNQKNPKNPCADINGDGRANLFDFSIMLFWWTG